MDILRALEMARCAEVNLDNLTKVSHFIENHPYTVIIKIQLLECIKCLEEEE